jgi:hypothetical protein
MFVRFNMYRLVISDEVMTFPNKSISNRDIVICQTTIYLPSCEPEAWRSSVYIIFTE